jgi:hypothetical protein
MRGSVFKIITVAPGIGDLVTWSITVPRIVWVKVWGFAWQTPRENARTKSRIVGFMYGLE